MVSHCTIAEVRELLKSSLGLGLISYVGNDHRMRSSCPDMDCVLVHIFMYIHIYIYLHIYIHIYIYTHTHICTYKYIYI